MEGCEFVRSLTILTQYPLSNSYTGKSSENLFVALQIVSLRVLKKHIFKVALSGVLPIQ
jgi:hypothetical protein